MNPTLYIIMRSDIADMNPGKGMAQAAHAQADFDSKMQKIANRFDEMENRESLLGDYSVWTENRNFGRTIVLSATKEDIECIAAHGKLSDFTKDPDYPWRNYYGETFLREEITCGWIFVCDTYDDDINLVKDLPLHK